MDNSSAQYGAKFFVGQCITHLRFDYRGVIIDVDPIFQGTEAWYQQVAKSRPPKDAPWYHVLVHDANGAQTYVAERHLVADSSLDAVRHPRLGEFFAEFDNGIYQPRSARN